MIIMIMTITIISNSTIEQSNIVNNNNILSILMIYST